MKKKLVTYFPLAVLAVGLALGMAVALMALWPGTSGQAYAVTQQVVGDNLQVYLGSANDPGGGDTSTQATITITFSSVPCGSGFNEPTLTVTPAVTQHQTASIPVVGKSHNSLAVPASLQPNNSGDNRITVTIITARATSQPMATTLFLPPRLPGEAAIRSSACSQGNGTRTLMRLNNTGALWGGSVAAPAHLALACSVCKGGAVLTTGSRYGSEGSGMGIVPAYNLIKPIGTQTGITNRSDGNLPSGTRSPLTPQGFLAA